MMLNTLLGPIPTSSLPALTVRSELLNSAIAPNPAVSTCIAATAPLEVAPNFQGKHLERRAA